MIIKTKQQLISLIYNTLIDDVLVINSITRNKNKLTNFMNTSNQLILIKTNNEKMK